MRCRADFEDGMRLRRWMRPVFIEHKILRRGKRKSILRNQIDNRQFDFIFFFFFFSLMLFSFLILFEVLTYLFIAYPTNKNKIFISLRARTFYVWIHNS